MSTALNVDFLHPPSECKLVIIPSYGSNGTYHMDNLISVTIDDDARVQVPREHPVDDSPLISLSIVYQIGPITNCIAGMNIPPDPEVVRLEFVTTGCVTFLVPSHALGGSSANYSTLTVGELKYSPDSTTSDGILQKKGETVSGTELSDGSIPYMYDQELKGAVIEGTSNQVEVAASYDGGTDTVALTLSLPQDISTTSSPEFQAINLKPSGASDPVTITAASSVSGRTYQIPDTGSSSQFVMTTGDQSIDGKKTFSDVEVKDEPAADGKTGAIHMGIIEDKGWQRIQINNEKKVGASTVKGGILLTHGLRTNDRAEVYINSIGDDVAEIFLGRGEPIPANIKWGISCRPPPGNELKIFRGPFLAGGDFKEVLSIDSKTGDITLASETDSSSTATGAVTTKGGLGVAKAIRASSLYLASTGGIPSPLSRYESFTLQDTLLGPWNGTKPVTIAVTIIGDQVTIRFPGASHLTEKKAIAIEASTSIIPLRIRPKPYDEYYFFVRVSNADVASIGTLHIFDSGQLVMYPHFNFADEWNYVSGKYTWWGTINLTYRVN